MATGLFRGPRGVEAWRSVKGGGGAVVEGAVKRPEPGF